METFYCPNCGADTSNPCGCVDNYDEDGAFEAREAYLERLAKDIELDDTNSQP